MFSSRGVQYVHCVMHKCIVVKVGENENHRKHVQNTEILRNWAIWESRGNERFVGNRGNWAERTKIEGNFKFVEDDFKKVIRNLFLGRGKTWKIYNGV